MAINMSKVRSLCSKSEKELFDSSSAKRIKELTPARLKMKVARSKKLRDKYRDLADKQQREMRGKPAPNQRAKAKSNEATRTKQQLFQELMERFEQALASAESAAATKPASGGKVSKKVAKATSKKAPVKKTAKKSTRKKVVSKKIRAKKAATKKAATRKAVAKKAAQSKATSKKMLSKKASSKRMQGRLRDGGATKIQGHVSSRGRRNQAKRDARGGR